MYKEKNTGSNLPAQIDILSTHGDELKSEFFIPTVVGTLLDRGAANVTMLASPDRWFGITHPQDKSLVAKNIRQLVDEGRYPQRLFHET